MTDLQQIADNAFEREEAKDEKVESTETKPVEEAEPEKVEEAEEKEEPVEDDGYTADDLEEEPAPSETNPIDPSKLPTREQWIYESLPSITVRGADGKEHTVKIAQELPGDFEFATKRDEAIFNQSLASQENRATKLLGEWEDKQQTETADKFRQQERLDIQADIASLQKSGDLPKFKVRPDDAAFKDDPGVKEVQKYIDFYEQRNMEYAKEGKAYRISFKDAVDIYNARNPKAPEKAPELKGDKERRETSARVGNKQQGDTPNKKEGRPRFKPGTQLTDILDYHMQRLD